MRVIHECIIFDDRCACTYYKPMLLQKLCSYVIVACAVIGIRTRRYISDYFKKEALFDTWNHEVYGFRIYGSFTKEPRPDAVFIPDTDKMKQKKGQRRTTRLRNDIDELEARRHVKCCNKCNGIEHFEEMHHWCPKCEPHESRSF